jgi:hypothetical protein
VKERREVRMGREDIRKKIELILGKGPSSAKKDPMKVYGVGLRRQRKRAINNSYSVRRDDYSRSRSDKHEIAPQIRRYKKLPKLR